MAIVNIRFIIFALLIFVRPFSSYAAPQTAQNQPQKSFWTKTKTALIVSAGTAIGVAGIILVYLSRPIPQSKSLMTSELFSAVHTGNHTKVSQLIDELGVDIQNDITHHTPLHVASMDGNTGMMELLISKHANINAKAYGVTPLELAVEYNQPLSVETLLKHNADPNSGHTPPLQWAVLWPQRAGLVAPLLNAKDIDKDMGVHTEDDYDELRRTAKATRVNIKPEIITLLQSAGTNERIIKILEHPEVD